MRILSVFVLAAVFLALAAAGGAWFWWFKGNSTGSPVILVVERGDNFLHLAPRLIKAGVIQDARAYRWYLNLFGQAKVLRRGEYGLHTGMSVASAVELLATGKVVEHSFTIPEGHNMFQVAERLAEQGFGSMEAFIAAFKNTTLIEQIPTLQEGEKLPESLEGYLFPDTYLLQKVYTPEEIAEMFLERFQVAYKQLHEAIATTPHLQALGLKPKDVVILASLVEKETGAAKERPLVASVFLNRLKKRMRLQCDPTTIYGIWSARGSFDGNIRRSDLHEATPYNTYTLPGLPIGPIANPGLEALRAVLQPAETNYLYFVSKNNGTHEFSADYKSHARFVDKLQVDPSARGDKSWRDLPASDRANNGP